MDSLTHIAVGACIGELVAGKKLGKKAMLLGALGQSVPDIDFVTGWWMPTAADLLTHRGFTHSILFAILCTTLLAFASERIFKNALKAQRWALFWGIQLFMHLFLDIFNVYGTGLLEPFSHYRVSLNTFFVLDPLFSMWPVLTLPVLLILKTDNVNRKKLAVIPLVISAIYMSYSIGNKLIITSRIEKDFKQQHVKVARYFSTPTPLNNQLWYIVAETDSGFYTGYSSVWDKHSSIDYRYVRKDTGLPAPFNNEETRRLIRFSQGYYTVSQWHDTIVFNDMRFGEMTAGLYPNPRFCFYYYLSPQLSNDVIIQRGRFCGWDKQTVALFIERIKGK